MPQVSATFPFRIVSPNVKEHWTKSSKRKGQQAGFLKRWWRNLKVEDKMSPPCTVTITRISSREYDHDNLIGACKGLRDSIADLLRPGMAPGQADGKGSGITWEYKQEKGEPKQYAVRIEIEENSRSNGLTTISPFPKDLKNRMEKDFADWVRS